MKNRRTTKTLNSLFDQRETTCRIALCACSNSLFKVTGQRHYVSPLRFRILYSLQYRLARAISLVWPFFIPPCNKVALQGKICAGAAALSCQKNFPRCRKHWWSMLHRDYERCWVTNREPRAAFTLQRTECQHAQRFWGSI